MSQQGEKKAQPRVSKHLQEVIVAGFLLAFFTFFLVRLDSFIVGRRGQGYLDPDAWPAALLSLGIVLSIIYGAFAFVGWRKELRGEEQTDSTDLLAGAAEEASAEEPEEHRPWLALGGLAMVAGYALVIPTMGFIPATMLFGIVFLLLLGERRWWLVLGVPLAVNAAIIGIFTQLLVVPLPRGVSPFLEFSTWLY